MIEVFSDLTKLNKLAVLFLALTKLFAIAGIVVGFSTDARFAAIGLFAYCCNSNHNSYCISYPSDV